MNMYQGRTLLPCTKVFIYFNLRRNCLSVKALEGEFKGKVVAHVDADETLVLKNVNFAVSEAGRQRVLASKQKNIHAGVIGHFIGLGHRSYEEFAQTIVSYNPYKNNSFVDAQQQPIYQAEFATLTGKNVYAFVKVGESIAS